MTIDERYKIQKKRSERLEQKLASLQFDSDVKNEALDGERRTLKELMQEVELLRDEFMRDVETLREYKRQYEILISSLREFKNAFEERFVADEDRWVIDHGGV